MHPDARALDQVRRRGVNEERLTEGGQRRDEMQRIEPQPRGTLTDRRGVDGIGTVAAQWRGLYGNETKGKPSREAPGW